MCYRHTGQINHTMPVFRVFVEPNITNSSEHACTRRISLEQHICIVRSYTCINGDTTVVYIDEFVQTQPKNYDTNHS